MTTQPPDSRNVFVVHGRDEKIRRSIFAFLRAIKLEPIEWTKAIEMTGKTAPYVGEILDAALRHAKAIVVVMTPDDEARLRALHLKDDDSPNEKELTPQARPNVLFEAGLAMGRAPDHTVLVQVGRVKPFSDVAGRHIIRLDNTQERRNELVQRLKKAGCPADSSDNDWLREGDFQIQEEPGQTVDAQEQTASSAPNAQRELEQTEVDILTAMAKGGDKGYTASQVAKMLGIDEQRAKYYLNKLRDSKHVDIRSFRDFDNVVSYYHIGKVGNAYLVEHNLV